MSPRVRAGYSDKYPYARRLDEIVGDKKNTEISVFTGVNAGTIADYMSGRQRPSADFLAGLAKNGYDTHYILTGEEAVVDSSVAIAEESNNLLKTKDEVIAGLKRELADKQDIIDLLQEKLSTQDQKLG